VTVVTKILLPATIGEDQPRPGSGVAHSILEVFDHVSGKLELMADGLDEGPRNRGHSGSPAKAQAIERDTMTQVMILLDYIFLCPLSTADLPYSFGKLGLRRRGERLLIPKPGSTDLQMSIALGEN